MENSLGSCSLLRRRRNMIRNKSEASIFDVSLIVDDLILDILSRLPAKDVLVSRCVCKKWRDLTSTKDFTPLHISRNFPPMILKEAKRQDLLDKCWEPARTRSKIYKLYEPRQIGILFSHNGLIVSYGVKKDEDFVIYNPIYRDAVYINVPYWSEVYGVFLHPLQKEYCTLWRITLSLKPWIVQYKILNLETNEKWRDIRIPCNLNARINHILPLLIENRYLYWIAEPFQYFKYTHIANNIPFNCDIIEYDITMEDFRVIPCPAAVSLIRYEYNVNLVDIDGVVSVVQVSSSNELVEITIWTMKDDGEKMWIRYNYTISSGVNPGHGMPKVIAFRNGELVLHSDERLYVCNLKLGTHRKFGQKCHYVKYFPHVMSPASLRNCTSNIRVVEEDKNDYSKGSC